MAEDVGKSCKYCQTKCSDFDMLSLQCKECNNYVHLKCLKRGAVPGGLLGDVFFKFTCFECSKNQNEDFHREKMPWFQALLLVLHNMQSRNPGIAKRGYFHWKIHISSFIDKHWDIIFKKGFKRKKNWTGTISGTLSIYSPLFFKSGTEVLNEQGWWKLNFPSLPPSVIVSLYSELSLKKQQRKILKLPTVEDSVILKEMLLERGLDVDELSNATVNISKNIDCTEWSDDSSISYCSPVNDENIKLSKTKRKLPTIEQNMKKCKTYSQIFCDQPLESTHKEILPQLQTRQFFNPFVLYATSNQLWNIQSKITGSIREIPVRSLYSDRVLPPYIFRSAQLPLKCEWLKLMEEIQVKTNSKYSEWQLAPKRFLDFVYLQPTLVPAINSLCNQFFWSGIDVSPVLQFPDFCCVVLYGKLIIAFALLIPDVGPNESYLAFIFTKPGWRRAGIAKRMLYFLLQNNTGRDITLHVSKNSNALLLYNLFSCKIEDLISNFYKQTSEDRASSQHAFFCRIKAF